MPIPGPLWAPRDENELQNAADGGLLEEGHYLDIKRELGTTDGSRKEAARDIASFTVDGGVLIYGVDEQPGAKPTLHPIPLAGESERVEGIAATRISEPISVRTTSIPASTGAGMGYLVVHVPKSPRAPHMVDGRYYGRDEKTKRVLTNAEVVLLHERRLATETDVLKRAVEELFATFSRCGGVPGDMIVVVAEPLGASDQLLVPLTAAGEGALATMRKLVRSATVREHQQQFEPTMAAASGYQRRARAVALTNGMLSDGRFSGAQYSAEIVFHESGRLVLASEGSVRVLNVPSLIEGTQQTKVIIEPLIAGHVDLMVRLAAAVSADFQFAGSWRFAVALGNDMNRAQSFLRTVAGHSGAGGPFTDGSYSQATSATLDDLNQVPHRVVTKLIGPLLRSVDSERAIAWLDPDQANVSSVTGGRQ